MKPNPNYIHVRNSDYRYMLRGEKNGNFELPAPCGGLTIAYRLRVIGGDKELGGEPSIVAEIGYARCSRSDNYKKKEGRSLADQMLENNPEVVLLPQADLSIARAYERGDIDEGYIMVYEREYPVIENVVEITKRLMKLHRSSKTKTEEVANVDVATPWPFS